MEELLIPASGLLVVCVTVFAKLADTWRRRAAIVQRQLDQALARQGELRKVAYNEGLFDGWKRGWSESYTAAAKAERTGKNLVDAIYRVGHINAPALLEEDKVAA